MPKLFVNGKIDNSKDVLVGKVINKGNLFIYEVRIVNKNKRLLDNIAKYEIEFNNRKAVLLIDRYIKRKPYELFMKAYIHRNLLKA